MKNIGNVRVEVAYQTNRGGDWYVASTKSKKAGRIIHGAPTARQAVSGLVPLLRQRGYTGMLKPVMKVSKEDSEKKRTRRLKPRHHRNITRDEVSEMVTRHCIEGKEVPVEFLVDVYFNEIGQIRDGLRDVPPAERSTWVSLSVRRHSFEIAMIVEPEKSSFIRALQARQLAAMAVYELLKHDERTSS